jgi:cytochrome c biogenesis protein CcdA
VTPSAEQPNSLSRPTEQALLVVVLALFGALTVVALAADGVAGIGDAITFNRVSVQIFVDLVIAIGVIMVRLHRDARIRGRNPWPWIVASLFTGMFFPLVYLLVRSRDS